ncbi:MAG TPA: TolC family protein [Thermoanaerobaculia bacterium]|nr:TolC family protein [Thermoanaerobaculia bacterium]
MKDRVTILAACILFVAAGCVTIPRDAGLGDVQRQVEERASQRIVAYDEPGGANQPRLQDLLAAPLTVDQVVAVSLLASPRLQATLTELGIARAALIEASTIANPMLEAELRFPGRPVRPYELKIAQSLVELIQLPRRRAIGRREFEAAKLRVTAEILRFAGDARDDYYRLLAASQRVAILGTVARAAQTAVDLAQRQHQGGNITDLDLEIEQSLYEESKLALVRAEEDLLLAREAMIRRMGLRDPGLEWSIAIDFPPPPESELPAESLQDLLVERRLDLLIARQEMEIARVAVPISRLAALGEIVIDGHLEREPTGEKTFGPGIEFPIPIFNTGRAARSRAEAEYLRSRFMLEALTLNAESEVRATHERARAARARIDYYRDVVLPRRIRILELTKLEHNAMLLGIYDVLEARRSELEARAAFIDAQRDYWMARNDLDRALNGVAAAEMLSAIDTTRTLSGTRRGGH